MDDEWRLYNTLTLYSIDIDFRELGMNTIEILVKSERPWKGFTAWFTMKIPDCDWEVSRLEYSWFRASLEDFAICLKEMK